MHSGRPAPPRHWRVLGLVLGGALLATACSSSRDPSAGRPVSDDGADPVDADVDSVVVIGDSITQGSKLDIEAALPAAGYQPLSVDGVSSRRTVVSSASQGGPSSGVEAVESAVASGLDPDVWVIALGTNDVLHYPGVDEYAGVITEMMSNLPDDAPVVWVDVYLRDAATAAGAFDAQLQLLLDQRPNTVVAEWSDVAGDDGVISDDGVHPTDQGYLVFASTIVSALDELSG